MKTRIRQSAHFPLLVSRKGMSRVRPANQKHMLDFSLQNQALKTTASLCASSPWKPTSIIKQPPDVDGSFALFLLKLLAALQQPLLRRAERRLGIWKQHHVLHETSAPPGVSRRSSALPLMISGLLWLLGTLEGLESESESLATLTEITTSLLLIGGFSWEDIRSSGRDRTREGHILLRSPC